MIVEIDGSRIKTEADFQDAIAKVFGLSHYYGKNLNALRDVLTRDVERPITLVWHNSRESQKSMPSEFRQIIQLLRDVEKWDAEFEFSDRFELRLQ